MKKDLLFFVVMILVLFAFICPVSTPRAADFHVTGGNELFSVLIDEVESNGEDDTVYLAAGTYFQDIPGYPPRGYFVASAGGNSLTIMGEPGTSASDVVIDAHGIGYCLRIIDFSLNPGNTDLPYETVMDPAFDRPRIVVSGITLQNGDAEYDPGGLSIQAQSYAVTVKDCIIRDNSTGSGRGGGVSISGAFNLIIENNRILRNTVYERLVFTGSPDDPVEEMRSRGGGIFVCNAWNGVIIRNNIVAGNVAMGDSAEGGGMYLAFSCNKTAHLINNTIYGNLANEGGGVYFGTIPGGTINLYNNIIYANTASGGEGSADLFFWEHPDVAEGWRPTVNAFNNNFSHALGTLSESGDNLDTDPLFVDPVADDFHLASDSPMINAGREVVPDPPGLPEHDFEGNGRVNGGAPDIGADEYYLRMGGAPSRKMSAGLDIRSDGKDGPIVKKLLARARLTISLAANDDKGKKSILSIVMNSPIGTFFLSKKGWIKEKAIYYQGPLKDILPIDLPRPPPFVREGNYEFRFGVEMQRQMPGQIKSAKKISSKIVLSDSIVFHVAGKNRKRPIQKNL